MVQVVAENAIDAVGRDSVVVVTDNRKIVEICHEADIRFAIVEGNLKSGTDRIAKYARQANLDWVVNLQGDEPMIDSEMISSFVDEFIRSPGMVLAGFHESESREPQGTPFVVSSSSGNLLYISRSPLPGLKDAQTSSINRQTSIYGFPITALDAFGEAASIGPLEQAEDIELIRLLENDTPVKLHKFHKDTVAVDYPHDVGVVESLLGASGA